MAVIAKLKQGYYFSGSPCMMAAMNRNVKYNRRGMSDTNRKRYDFVSVDDVA